MRARFLDFTGFEGLGPKASGGGMMGFVTLIIHPFHTGFKVSPLTHFYPSFQKAKFVVA